ncbi:hypothetical protein IQ07DRAFT_584972 [Pyrenochaeta sp. DS3sAY3a]|nr:hypothetical protein IQ07DRAFT_584972 [Pyrenochaeta sp. DS3sAY3a]
MNELTAHRLRWRNAKKIVLYIRRFLLIGLSVSWFAPFYMTAASEPGSFEDSANPIASNPVERRRLRAAFSISVLLHVTLLASLISFSLKSNRPVSRLKASIGFDLAGAILLSLTLTFYLGFSKNQRLLAWSTQSVCIQSASASIAVSVLVQTFLICLEAWWLPKALRVPFHNEPTVKTRSERNGTNTVSTQELCQQRTDAGPLERLFAKQSSPTASARPVPEAQSTSMSPSRIKSTSAGGPQLRTNVLYWAQHDISAPGKYVLFTAIIGTLWAPMEISAFYLRKQFEGERLWVNLFEFAYPLISLACLIITSLLIVSRIPPGRKIMGFFRLDLTMLATVSLIIIIGWAMKLVFSVILNRWQSYPTGLIAAELFSLILSISALLYTFWHGVVSFRKHQRLSLG